MIGSVLCLQQQAKSRTQQQQHHLFVPFACDKCNSLGCFIAFINIINDFVFDCQQSIWRCRTIPQHLPLTHHIAIVLRINLFFYSPFASISHTHTKQEETCPYFFSLLIKNACFVGMRIVFSSSRRYNVRSLQFTMIFTDPQAIMTNIFISLNKNHIRFVYFLSSILHCLYEWMCFLANKALPSDRQF